MMPYPLADGWTIAVDSDGRWAVSERGFTYVDFDTEALALAWYAGFMYAQRVHQTGVLAEAGLLADGTGDRFAEFSVHDAWLWHQPCRTELDAIAAPWTLVELVASARSHLSGCVGSA